MKGWRCRSGQTFFGLEPKISNDAITGEEIYDFTEIDLYKKTVYDELFALAYYGNGGWNWEIAYALPVHIRRYCLKNIKDIKEKENEEIEKSKKAGKSTNTSAKVPTSVGTAYNRQPRKPNLPKNK